MKILCLTTFLDGSNRFEKDDVRNVSDADGQRFVSHGWAREANAEALAAFDGPTQLVIDNVVTNVTDKVGG